MLRVITSSTAFHMQGERERERERMVKKQTAEDLQIESHYGDSREFKCSH